MQLILHGSFTSSNRIHKYNTVQFTIVMYSFVESKFNDGSISYRLPYRFDVCTEELMNIVT